MEKTDKALIDIFLYGHVRPAWRKNEARYQDSWDRLMPVVEKIGEIAADDRRVRSRAFHEVASLPITSKIEWVYKAVVEFIKWYTSNQPKKQ